MNNYSESLGTVLRSERGKTHQTKVQVAELVGVTEKTILNIENNKGNPKLKALYSIVRSLNLDANTIFYPESSTESQSTHELIHLLSQRSEADLDALLPIVKACVNAFDNGNPLES